MFGIIGVYATSSIIDDSSEIVFDNTNTNLQATNVEDAIIELYNGIGAGVFVNEDMIVANWLNEKYTISTSWQTFLPTLYSDSFFTDNNGTLTFKKAGNYRIYYQSAYDGGTNGQGHVRILINGNPVATCGNSYARCDNRLIYYDASINVNDTITVQGYTTNASMGARVVVSVVLLKD